MLGSAQGFEGGEIGIYQTLAARDGGAARAAARSRRAAARDAAVGGVSTRLAEHALVRDVTEAQEAVGAGERSGARPDQAEAMEFRRGERGAVEPRTEDDLPGQRAFAASIERARERLDAAARVRLVAQSMICVKSTVEVPRGCRRRRT